MAKISAKQLKIAGLIPLLIPSALLLILTVGETAGGDLAGLAHLIMLAPLVILAIFAWKKPDLAGKILIVIAALLAISNLPHVFLLVMGSKEGMGIGPLISNVLLFSGSLIISGLLFIASARKES